MDCRSNVLGRPPTRLGYDVDRRADCTDLEEPDNLREYEAARIFSRHPTSSAAACAINYAGRVHSYILIERHCSSVNAR